MTDKNLDDTALEALFTDARKTSAVPSADFMARLAADAEDHLPGPVASVTTPPHRTNWLAGFFTASGLSGAAIAGVWLGFAMPDAIDTLDFSADTTVALSTFLPSADLGVIFDE